MRNRFLALVALFSFSSCPFAGERMTVCRDAQGNVMFTQTTCDDSSDRRSIYVQSAQSSGNGLTKGERAIYGRIQAREKANTASRSRTVSVAVSSGASGCPKARKR